MSVAAAAPSGDRLLPQLDDLNRAFWTGGAQGALLIQRCADCGLYVHPPAPVCRRCFSRAITPIAVSGRGHVHSYTINRQPWRPEIALPYVIALVELVEQPMLRLTTNLIDIAPDDVTIDLPVEVVFEQDGEIWVPLFRPLR